MKRAVTVILSMVMSYRKRVFSVFGQYWIRDGDCVDTSVMLLDRLQR